MLCQRMKTSLRTPMPDFHQFQKTCRLNFLFVPAVVIAAACLTQGAHASTASYNTAGISTFAVPANVTSIQITITGAAGGAGGSDGSFSGGAGGFAGHVTGAVAVSPGDTLYFYLGGPGANGTSNTSNGGGGGGGAWPRTGAGALP